MHICDQFKVAPMLWQSSMLMEWLQTFSQSLRDTVLETEYNGLCLLLITFTHPCCTVMNVCEEQDVYCLM